MRKAYTTDNIKLNEMVFDLEKNGYDSVYKKIMENATKSYSCGLKEVDDVFMDVYDFIKEIIQENIDEDDFAFESFRNLSIIFRSVAHKIHHMRIRNGELERSDGRFLEVIK